MLFQIRSGTTGGSVCPGMIILVLNKNYYLKGQAGPLKKDFGLDIKCNIDPDHFYRHVAKLRTQVEGDSSLMTYTGHTILQTLIRYKMINIAQILILYHPQVPFLSGSHHGPEPHLHWLRCRARGHL